MLKRWQRPASRAKRVCSVRSLQRPHLLRNAWKPFSRDVLVISWLPRLVLFGTGRANECRRPRLNDFRKFAQVFADVAHIFEKLVNIFGVRVERAVQLPGERLELREIPAQ